MFSALKKLTTRSSSGESGNSHNGTGLPPPGLTTMSSSLQKKFAKGVHYNMKIILKGDRNVGKTQVFKRLQGLSFAEEYTSTEEIQVANITWNYKTSDDIVKVEIWDVVDVANKKKRITDKLKIENCSEGNGDGDSEMASEIALDANTIDVYKNTNGVLLVFDITKNWTFDYVKREILNVPEHIPVLILGNRCDMGHHRAVAGDTVIFFIEALERNADSAEIRYAESSMRNGFGLKFIHKFFNLPFLHLQKATLLKQLETNRDETEITVQELDLYCEGDDANYDLFIDGLTHKRRLVADALSPPRLSLAEAQALASERALKESKGGTTSAAAAAAKVIVNSDPTSNAAQSLPPAVANKIHGASSKQQSKQSDTAVKGVITDIIAPQKSKVSNSPNKPDSTSSGDSGVIVTKTGKTSAKALVDDFVPDEDDYTTSFFDDNQAANQYASNQKYGNQLHYGETSDDEVEAGQGNPMVLALEEDIEVDKIVISNPQTHQSQLSSSEDEAQAKSSQNERSKSVDEKMGFSMFMQNNVVNNNDTEEAESQEEKKSSKKSHHKKSKHKKSHKSKDKDKDRHQRDLEDFLSGDYVSKQQNLDTSAYEAM